MTGSMIVGVVVQYMAAWNSVDAAVRNELLKQCWSERGNYIDPTVVLVGRDALEMHIAQVHAVLAQNSNS